MIPIIFTLECIQCLYIGTNVWKMVIAKYIYIYICIYIYIKAWIQTIAKKLHYIIIQMFEVHSSKIVLITKLLLLLWRLSSIISDRNKLSCSWEHNSNRRMKAAKTTHVAVVLQWIACRFIINFRHPQYTHSEGRVWWYFRRTASRHSVKAVCVER